MPLPKPQDCYVRAGAINARYWRSGNRGSPVLLIHGLGASADIWLNNIASLARNHRVYVPDLPGFGHSEIPQDGTSPFLFVQFLDDFLAALNIERASLVGHSLGGGIALFYTIRYPHKVDRLVLADSAGLGREVIYTLRLMKFPIVGELMSYPTRLGVSLFFKLAVRDRTVITDDIIDTYCEFFRRPGARQFLLRVVRSMVAYHGGRRDILEPIMTNLGKIMQPTLIIWGRLDRVLPVAHAYGAREKIPDARLHIFDECGHITNLERPGEFNRLVSEFLADDHASIKG